LNLFNSGFGRYNRAVLLLAAVAGIVYLLWVLRGVLLPFGIGLLLAWLLQPVINGVEHRLPGFGSHHNLKRVSTIVGIYVITAALIGLGTFYVVTVLGRAVVTLMVAAPDLIPQGIDAIDTWLDSVLTPLSPALRNQVDALLMEAGVRGGQALVNFITSGVLRIRGSSGMILGFVASPVFLFYLLKDWDSLRQDLYSSLPHWIVLHVRNVASIVHNVVGRYLQGQLILGIAVGFAVYVLLSAAGIPYAGALGVFGGITELVPVVGPWLAGIVGVLVVLATAPEQVFVVALGYVLIQLLENNLLVPRVQGRQMHLHPALVIVLTIVAASRLGFLGFLLVLPVTMTIAEIAKYARKELRGTEQVGG
jgi:predicted PurR-regulated permease PerM